MKLNRWILTGGLAVTAVASAANDTNDAVDTMNTVSQKALMRTGSTNFKGIDADDIYGALPFERFDVIKGGDNPGESAKWCLKAAGDMQKSRGNVDAKTGEARITSEAIVEACSSSYIHEGKTSLTCFIQVKQTPLDLIQKKPAHPYAVCNAAAELTFRRYKAAPSGESVTFSADPKFGKGGVAKIDSTYEDNTAIPDKGGKAAEDGAILISRKIAKTFVEQSLRRQMLDIRDFQLHAPIAAAKGGTVKACIGSDIGYLDQPMFAVVTTASGEKQVGFTKLRTLKDGCSMTSALEERQKKGAKLALGPSEGEVILGGSSIKAGMTLWEMPSIGLNIGLGIAALTGPETTSTKLRFDFEYNVARFLNVSELYLSGYADTDSSAPGTESAQYAVGLTKRFFIAGPVFFDLGAAGLTGSLAGFRGTGGLGLQLAPRFLMRAQASTVQTVSSGFEGGLGLLYTL